MGTTFKIGQVFTLNSSKYVLTYINSSNDRYTLRRDSITTVSATRKGLEALYKNQIL